MLSRKVSRDGQMNSFNQNLYGVSITAYVNEGTPCKFIVWNDRSIEDFFSELSFKSNNGFCAVLIPSSK